jgi:hypothetical protein
MKRAVLIGALQGLLRGLLLAALTFGVLETIDYLRGPHLQLVCTSSYAVTETILVPTVDGNGYSSLMPMVQTRSQCTSGYNICVNRHTQVDAHFCTESSR